LSAADDTRGLATARGYYKQQIRGYCRDARANRIKAALNERKRTGEGVPGIAKRFGIDPSTVQRIARPFADAAA
jgi:hypothetical protein